MTMMKKRTTLAGGFFFVFVALFALAVPVSADERRSPLAGAGVEFDSGRLSVEVPEGCRVAGGGEGASLVIEDPDGTRTKVSAENGENRVSVDGGRISIVVADSAGDLSDEPETVVESEGILCDEEPDERNSVLSETSDTTVESDEEAGDTPTDEATSAGQEVEPLSDEATINYEGGDQRSGEIESITISADGCESGEEPSVEDGAEITLSDSEDDFVFTDDDNVDFTSDGSTVTIAPADNGGGLSSDGVNGGTLDEDTATVESQTGITCGAEEDGSDDDGAGTPTTSGSPGTGAASCESGESLTDITAFSQDVEEEDAVLSDEFTTTGDFFQVRYRATATGTDEDEASFRLSVVGEDGAESVSAEADLDDQNADESGTLDADLPAGTYRLRVVAENVQYDLTVAECREGSPTTSVPETSDPRDGVIADSVPNKSLANTGGPNLAVITAGSAFIVLGASFAWFLVRRRGV